MEVLFILVVAFILVQALHFSKEKPREEIKLKGLKTFGRRETK